MAQDSRSDIKPLLSQQGNDFVLHGLQKFGKRIRLQVDGNVAGEHVNLLGSTVAKRRDFRWTDLVQGT
jgi:hypothetical protein